MIQHVEQIIRMLEQAGELIISVYVQGSEGAQVEWKEDNSPLTLADRLSHDHLVKHLSDLDSSIPIMSEESTQLAYSERCDWAYYWCLDPLDGTKEFIKRNDQFTINLALMHNGFPVLSFIHLPVGGQTYWAASGRGAYCKRATESYPIYSNRKSDSWVAVGSGSHGSELEQALLQQFPVTDSIKVGSALKFCYVAEGRADIYYRQGPTMEWDTAAGHLLVQEAGALFEFLNTDGRIYNKESLVNSSFLVRIQMPEDAV